MKVGNFALIQSNRVVIRDDGQDEREIKRRRVLAYALRFNPSFAMDEWLMRILKQKQLGSFPYGLHIV